jgi:hypothetical protein
MYPQVIHKLSTSLEEGSNLSSEPVNTGSVGAEQRFTDEQQAVIDRLVSSRLSRAKESWEADLRRQLGFSGSDVFEEVKRLKALELSARARNEWQRADEPLSPGDWERREMEWQERLRQADESRVQNWERYATTLRRQEARIAVGRIAPELHADALELFERELSASLGVDEGTGEVYPLGEDGKRALRPTGEHLTMDDLVENLRKKYPSMVKTVRGGSGAVAGRVRPSTEFERRLASASTNPTLERTAHAFQALLEQE